MFFKDHHSRLIRDRLDRVSPRLESLAWAAEATEDAAVLAEAVVILAEASRAIDQILLWEEALAKTERMLMQKAMKDPWTLKNPYPQKVIIPFPDPHENQFFGKWLSTFSTSDQSEKTDKKT
jgi:hypothetical protein